MAGRPLGIESVGVWGGTDVDPDVASLRCGVDVLVATPGRLLKLLSQRDANLKYVSYLVLDEADMMFVSNGRCIMK